jgi:type II secretion system protein H
MVPNHRRWEQGFTLTELLVVLAVIGIFTGIMVAEMRGTFQEALLRSSARGLMSGLSLASTRAVSLNQAHLFELNRAENEFVVRAQARAPKRGLGTAEEEDRAAETSEIDERITVEIRDPAAVLEEEPGVEPAVAREQPRSERDTIRFYPDGTADAREIILRDNNNAELVLRVNPITGRVRVQEEAQ